MLIAICIVVLTSCQRSVLGSPEIMNNFSILWGEPWPLLMFFGLPSLIFLIGSFYLPRILFSKNSNDILYKRRKISGAIFYFCLFELIFFYTTFYHSVSNNLLIIAILWFVCYRTLLKEFSFDTKDQEKRYFSLYNLLGIIVSPVIVILVSVGWILLCYLFVFGSCLSLFMYGNSNGGDHNLV